VRLGSQTESERIKEYNLEEICKRYNRNKQLIRSSHSKLDSIERKINYIKNILLKKWVSWDDIQEYLKNEEMAFYDKFINVSSDNNLPSWVLEIINTEEDE